MFTAGSLLKCRAIRRATAREVEPYDDGVAPLIDGSTAPSPEGVVILGMHRSGTSLITRLVNLLGLAVCRHDDLLVGRARNPRGHWESKSLLRYNDELLDELGGSWFCPPSLEDARLERLLRRHAADALVAIQAAHPERPWVWKDPRTCVLLPFWSAVLAQRAVYVLVVRHPFEVSDSLARRNGCTPLLSLALWERYTRAAMLGAAGRPVMVCTYDGVLADPAAWCERLGAFLVEAGLSAHPADRLAVDAFVMDELRHSSQSWSDLQPGPQISAEQVALARAASGFTAQLSYRPPELPDETPQSTAIFSEIANMKPRARSLAALPARLVTRTAMAADREDATARPLSIVMARGAGDVQTALAALGEGLPAGSELIVAGGDLAEIDPWARDRGVRVQEIDCDRHSGDALAMALGAQAASGRIVALSSSALLRCDPWYTAFEQALEEPLVGCVGPVMRFESCPQLRHFGRAFADEDLVSRFVTGRAAQALEPAALLSAAHSIFARALLAAAGGLDGEFAAASAAVAELSVRVWRMGYRCRIVSQVEAWARAPDAERAGADDAEQLYDRLRIATLHFDRARLQAFTDRARAQPGYEVAAERLAATDVRRRRAAIEAVCAFPAERYFERFPVGNAGGVDGLAGVRRARGRPLARLLKRAGLR